MSISLSLVGALALTGVTSPENETADLDDVAAVDSTFNLVMPVDVTVTPFGRVQLDGVWGSGDAPFDTVDQVGFRRARVGVKGKAGVFDFKAEYDFAGGDPDFADVWMGWKNSPLGNATVGNFKEPVGLEELTSSRFTTFIERALPDVFTPSRNVGIGFADSTERVAWQYGVFGSDTDSFGWGTVDGQYAVTGRVTGVVFEDDSNVVHLGVSASNRSQDGVRYRSRPEVPFVSSPADTGVLDNDGVFLYGAEAAWVGGPWSAQGEFLAADVDNAGGVEDATFSGYYVEGSYYLTGESRNYKQATGRFDRPPVKEDFDGEGGMGAIQLAVRYSMLDLNDGPSADELEDFTLGVNWWLNNHTRIAGNYVNASFDRGAFSEDADYLVIRFQVDF